MPLPLKLFEISDVVLKDENKGEISLVDYRKDCILKFKSKVIN
jgi:hypothetical protein